METGTNPKLVLLAAAIMLVLVAIGVYWYLIKPASTPIPSSVPGNTAQNAPAAAPALAATTTGGQDIGSSIYEKAANPVQDKLPDTVAPVANPLEGAYKNPFQ